jgi:hypothetical protein
MRPWVTCYTKSGIIKFTKEQWMEGPKRLSLLIKENKTA